MGNRRGNVLVSRALALGALGALPACLLVLDPQRYRSSDVATTDGTSRDAAQPDARIDAGAPDEGTDAFDAPRLDAPADDVALDVVRADAVDVVAADRPVHDAVDVALADRPVQDVVDVVAHDATPDAPTACSGGNTLCGTTCVDTQTDVNHCGGCDTICLGGSCVAGRCGGECYVDSDCASRGYVCSSTPHCGAVPFCEPPMVLCGCSCASPCGGVGAAVCPASTACDPGSGCCGPPACTTDATCSGPGARCVGGECHTPGTCGPPPA